MSKEKVAARMEEAASTLKAVYSELPTYDRVVPALLEAGLDGLRDRCKLTPGVPLKPMLAKPTKAIGEVLDRFESKRFTCEYKYDGERAQVRPTPPLCAPWGPDGEWWWGRDRCIGSRMGPSVCSAGIRRI